MGPTSGTEEQNPRNDGFPTVVPPFAEGAQISPRLAVLGCVRLSHQMRLEEIPYLDAHGEIQRTQNLLPHWHQNNRTYFVTFRLGDSLPQLELDRLEEQRSTWCRHHPEPWTIEVEKEYHNRFSTRIEQWLDAGHGSCHLRNPSAASIVGEALSYFEGSRTTQLAWVVMPNHVHTLLVLHAPHRLDVLIASWKRNTALRINRELARNGSFWQRDYFDRVIRDPNHLCNCIRYIRRNPEKGRLGAQEYLLWQSELALGIE